MKAHTIQTSLIAGMLDENAAARSETALYRNGARSIRNGLPLATGGILSRWGSQHAGVLAAGPAANYRIEEFSFSLAQSYVAVFFAGTVAFFFAEDGVAANGLGSMPWTDAMVPDLRFAQSGDTMFVVHPDIVPVVITRTGATSWAGVAITYTANIAPVFRYEPAGVSCTYAAIDTSLQFSAPFLTAGHVGTIMRVYDNTTSRYRYGQVTTVATSTRLAITWLDTALTDGNVTTAWEEQAFSSVRGYARSVCIYQQRLVFGGSRDAGDAVWMSRLGRYFDFNLGTAADIDAIAISLGTTRVRTIQHTVAGPQLTFLTENAALYLPESELRPITPASLPKVRVISAVSAGSVRPGNFDGGVLMVTAAGNSVRDIAFSTETENLVADPVSLVVTDSIGTIIDAAYLPGSQDRPEQYALFVTSDGRMMLFHSVREQRITAWAEWTTDGLYKAVGQSAGRLFAVVVRGGTARLERFDDALSFDASVTDTAPFVAAHLPGKTIHARLGNDYFGFGVADGAGAVSVTRQLPSAGGLPAGQLAELGLAFDFWIDPLPPSLDLPDGNLLGRVQRLLRCGIRLYQARSASIDSIELSLRNESFPVNQAPAPRDGWWSIPLLGFARRDDPAALCPRLGRSTPMPVGILAFRREIVL